MIKIDMHLHSYASNKSAGFFSNKFDINESYVSPQELYDTLFQRGMSHFTITDHDSIDGCLEIAHLPNSFISEEVSAYFPEDRCKVHVLTYDIDEKTHKEISHLRYNLYDLIDYYKKEDITHAIAHPLYDMDGKLSSAHIEKLLLLFDNWEIINGTRSKLSSILTKDIARRFNRASIEALANKHGFNKRERDVISFIAGSDDHGGLDIGKTYTSCEGENLIDLKHALKIGATKERGEHGCPTRLSHMIMNIAYSSKKDELGSLNLLFEPLFNHSPKKKFYSKILKQNRGVEYIKKVIKKDKKVDFSSADTHEVIHGFFKNFMPYLISQFGDMKGFQFDKVSMLIGKIIFSIIPNIVYVSTYWQRALEKKRSVELHRKLTGDSSFELGKVAYFTDTMFEINGVARTSVKLCKIAEQENYNIKFITCYNDKQSTQYIKNFEPLLSVPFPEYEELNINMPNFLEVLEYCDKHNFEVIYAPTPGVVGLYGFLIAKILHLPFITTFHTDFPSYAKKYTGDHIFTRHMWSFFAALYNNSNRVLSPSKEYEKILIKNGVKRNKIEVFRRGVNHEKFNTSFRDKSFWGRFKEDFNEDKKVVLYVGRVAKEKNIDIFLDCAEALKDRDDVYFIAVGDGPYKDEVQDRYKDSVIFTGYLEGDELSVAYASADIFLFPSTTETFGNVVLEAEASGLPCIVSDLGASKENIEPNVTGFIAKGESADEYIDKVITLLDGKNMLNIMRDNCVEYSKNFKERELLIEMLKTLSIGKIKPKREVIESMFA